MGRYDEIEEVQPQRVAKTFNEIIEKFNPFHGADGKFSNADGYATFTVATKDPKKQHMADMAIARMKDKEAQGAAAGAPQRDYKSINESDVAAMAKEMGQDYDPVNFLDANDYGYFGNSSSWKLNNSLRSGDKLSQEQKDTVKELDADMKPSSRDIKVQRAIGGSILKQFGVDPHDVKQEDMDTKMIGKVYANKGYTSTSYDMDKNFFTSRQCVLNINVPKGAKMMIRPDGLEAEILLARGTAMKITGAKLKDYGDVEIDLEVIV